MKSKARNYSQKSKARKPSLQTKGGSSRFTQRLTQKAEAQKAEAQTLTFQIKTSDNGNTRHITYRNSYTWGIEWSVIEHYEDRKLKDREICGKNEKIREIYINGKLKDREIRDKNGEIRLQETYIDGKLDRRITFDEKGVETWLIVVKESTK